MLASYFRIRGFVIACQDEATFGLIPNVVRGWARIGSRPISSMNFQHKKINVFGARSKRAFVYSFHKRKTQKEFISFLNKLLKQWKKVCLFIDSGPGHKGKKIEEFLKRHSKTLHIEYFPKYCPELNPVEPCWKPARKKIGNRLNRNLSSLMYHLRSVFDNPSLMPKMFKYLSD